MLDLVNADFIDALDTDRYRVHWVMGSFLVGSAAGMTMTGLSAALLGLRRAFLYSLILFCVMNGLCGCVNEVIWMTPLRLLEGNWFRRRAKRGHGCRLALQRRSARSRHDVLWHGYLPCHHLRPGAGRSHCDLPFLALDLLVENSQRPHRRIPGLENAARRLPFRSAISLRFHWFWRVCHLGGNAQCHTRHGPILGLADFALLRPLVGGVPIVVCYFCSLGRVFIRARLSAYVLCTIGILPSACSSNHC